MDAGSGLAWAPGDRLVWQGRNYEVVKVALHVTANHEQVVLRLLDQPTRLPLSIPASDLADARRLS